MSNNSEVEISPGEVSNTETLIQAILVALFSLIAFTSNSIIILTFLKNRSLRSKDALYFITLLAVNDWLNSITNIIAAIYRIWHLISPLILNSVQCL
jgi:hypothetical protein